MCLGETNVHQMLNQEMNLVDSLKLQITMNIFKFWIHLENQPTYSIAWKLCLNISDKMAQENKSTTINQ